MNGKEELLHLAEKISRGTATDNEIARYNAWYNAQPFNDEWNEDELGSQTEKKQAAFLKINQDIKKMKAAKVRSMTARIATAAIILLCLSFGLYLMPNRNNTLTKIAGNKNKPNDLPPGSNKMILTLTNGEKIAITDATNGIIAQQSGIVVAKKGNGEIVYSGAGNTNGNMDYNIAETPNAAQYQLTLSDGTKVYLNAGSSLRYPVAFKGRERKVELNGEAYFEVSDNPAKPFKVISKDQVVEVLGTHFNINSYADEDVIKTTLLQGSVSVTAKSGQTFIKPGQQAQVYLGHMEQKTIVITDADMDEAIAWKNGLFYFNGASIKQVMYNAARWYDIKVVYTSHITDLKLSGKLSRKVNLSGLINILKFEGIQCKVEGRTVYILN